MRIFLVVFYLFWLGNSASFAADGIKFSAPEAWVKATSIPSSNPKYTGFAAQNLLMERQDYFGIAETSSYIEIATLIQSAEGLAQGNIAIAWQPETEELTVHRVNIIRDGKLIDVFANGQEFTVLRREPNLEFAMLDGVQTATLQPEGLRVGDTLNIAYTIKHSNPVLQNYSNSFLYSILNTKVELLRLRQFWPPEKDIRWRVSDDLPKPIVKKTKRGTELILEMRDTEPPKLASNAPLSHYIHSSLETSDFENWSEVSAVFFPLFEAASQTEDGSELLAEAQKIAAATSDPIERMEMALKLVQEQIRYVFVGLNSGGYVPIPAEEAWARRYGDCKAKTVALIALLTALGVEAEPALVSSAFGEGLNQRLPSIALFDHVIVRATVDGKEYWLDGTRTGDVSLERLITPAFFWSLPVRKGGANLSVIEHDQLEEPNSTVKVTIDARSGLDLSPIDAEVVIYGDNATASNIQYQNLTDEQRFELLSSVWSVMMNNVTVDETSMSYDENTGVATFVMSGSIKLPWKIRRNKQSFVIPNAALDFDVTQFSDKERTAAWALPFPFFETARTVILLPNGGQGFVYEGNALSVSQAGVELEYAVDINDARLTMDRSMRFTTHKLSAENARELASLISESNKSVRFTRLSTAPMTDAEISVVRDLELDSPKAYVDRGVIFLDQRKYDEAYEDFAKAIEIDPEYSWAYANRGVASVWLENYGSAKRDFEKALSLSGENWVAHQGFGLMALNKNEFDSAIGHFDAALEENPDSTFAVARRGIAYWRAGDQEASLADFNRYIELAPRDPSGYLEKTRLLMSMGRLEDATETVSNALELDPDNIEFYALRSYAYEQLGEIEPALQDLDRVLDIDRDNPTMLNNRCWFLGTRNMKLDQALLDCEKAIEIQPETAPFLDSRGLVYFQMGKHSKAIDDYNAALALAPEQATSLFGRGVARLMTGDDGGQADIDSAISLSPFIRDTFEEYGVIAPE